MVGTQEHSIIVRDLQGGRTLYVLVHQQQIPDPGAWIECCLIHVVFCYLLVRARLEGKASKQGRTPISYLSVSTVSVLAPHYKALAV